MTFSLTLFTVVASGAVGILSIISKVRELRHGSPIVIFGIPVSELVQESILIVIGLLVGRILLERWSLEEQIKLLYEKVKRIWEFLGLPKSVQNVSLYTERTRIGASHPNQYEDYIKDAKHEILIIGVDARTTVDSYIGSLKDKLKQESNLNIYFLLMNPWDQDGKTNCLVENIAQVIGLKPETQRLDIENRLRRLKEIREKELKKEERKRWHILVYDFSSTFTFLSVDGNLDYGKILYGFIPYKPKDKNHWPLIEFRRQNDDAEMEMSLYEFHKRMFTNGAKEPDWSKLGY